ncbi:MAG: hypothetical protein AAF668_11560, partial [Pseudomonadota bacterium]
ALAALKTEFSGLRTGRASAALVEPITVDAYGWGDCCFEDRVFRLTDRTCVGRARRANYS